MTNPRRADVLAARLMKVCNLCKSGFDVRKLRRARRLSMSYATEIGGMTPALKKKLLRITNYATKKSWDRAARVAFRNYKRAK